MDAQANKTDEQIGVEQWLQQLSRGTTEARNHALAAIDAYTQENGLSVEALDALNESQHNQEEDVRKGIFGIFQRVGGHAVSFLLKARQSSNDSTRNLANSTLGAMGTGAIPGLIQSLDHENQNIRQMAASSLGKQGSAAQDAVPKLLELLKNDCSDVQSTCAAALSKIGMGEPAVEEALLGALRDANAHSQSVLISALSKMGATNSLDTILEVADMHSSNVCAAVLKAMERFEVSPDNYIKEALNSDDLKRKRSAIYLLDASGHTDTLDNAQWLELLATPDSAIREKILNRLYHREPGDNPDSTNLFLVLQDTNMEVRRMASLNLLRLDAKVFPKEAEETLVGILKDDHWQVRESAAKMLGAIPASTSAAGPLCQAMLDGDYDVKRAAANALKQVRVADPAVLPQLIEGADAPLDDVQAIAIELIGDLGEAAIDTLNLLEQKIRHYDHSIQQAAAKSMSRIGEKAIPVLLELTQEEIQTIEDLAIEALQQMEGDTSATLLRFFLDESAPLSIRWNAYKSMSQVQAETKLSVPLDAIATLLEDKEDSLRFAAFTLLAQTDVQDENLWKCTKGLDDHDWQIRACAAHQLGQMGTKAIEAYPALLRCFQDKNEHDETRCEALEAIWHIAPTAPETKQAALHALHEPNWELRATAAEMLRMADQCDLEMTTLLQNLTHDPFHLVRQEATQTLQLFGVA
jgi:HEAT repeat protein